MPIKHECGWELPRETTLGVCPRCGKAIASGYERIPEMTGANHQTSVDAIDGNADD